MLKRLAILTVLLLMLPVETYTQAQQAKERSASQKPPSAAPATTVQQTDSPKLQPEERKQIDANVRIVSAPDKDGYDYASLGINLALAIVGMAGVGIGVCTLIFIRAQVIEMRFATQEMSRSAKATEDSVRAFVASQGPQITVTAHGDPPTDLFGDPSRVQVQMGNRGPTTAYDLTYEFWIEVVPWEFDGFTDAAYHYSSEHRLTVYSQQQNPVILNLPMGRNLSAEERREIKALEKQVSIRIKVFYRDKFSSRRHWAEFGYWMQKDGFGFLRGYNNSGTEPDEKAEQPN